MGKLYGFIPRVAASLGLSGVGRADLVATIVALRQVAEFPTLPPRRAAAEYPADRTIADDIREALGIRSDASDETILQCIDDLKRAVNVRTQTDLGAALFLLNAQKP